MWYDLIMRKSEGKDADSPALKFFLSVIRTEAMRISRLDDMTAKYSAKVIHTALNDIKIRDDIVEDEGTEDPRVTHDD